MVGAGQSADMLSALLLASSAAAGASPTPPGAPLGGLEHRPQYHLLSQGRGAGWVSDPNGPLFANGRYHMFYQAATSAQMRMHKTPYHTPDPISWGHMSSPDLTHWEQHPMAISPAGPQRQPPRTRARTSTAAR